MLGLQLFFKLNLDLSRKVLENIDFYLADAEFRSIKGEIIYEEILYSDIKIFLVYEPSKINERRSLAEPFNPFERKSSP